MRYTLSMVAFFSRKALKLCPVFVPVITWMVFLISILSLFSPQLLVKASTLNLTNNLPNDQDLIRLKYLNQINAPAVWKDIKKPGVNSVTAIIDTGVDITHPELTRAIWTNNLEIPNNNRDDDSNGYIDDINGWNFIENTNNVRPKLIGADFAAGSHGTAVAGIIAAEANNIMGGAGIAYQAKILPLVALDNQGEGFTDNVVRAIDYAIAQQADVINLSLVSEAYSSDLDQAITRAWNAGLTVVVAAGNDNGIAGRGNLNLNPLYPACNNQFSTSKSLISVASVDDQDQLSVFSDYGSNCVDLVAPGENVYSTVPYQAGDPKFKSFWTEGFSGTSISVAMVSAAAAILKSEDRQLTPAEIRSFLIAGADTVDQVNQRYRGQLGAGRLNVKKSYDLFLQNQVQGINYLDNTLVRVRATRQQLELDFTRPDGKLSTTVKITDGPKGNNWRASIGYFGSFGPGNSPVIALFPPAGQANVVRLYNWSGQWLKNIEVTSPSRAGLTGALIRVDGTNDWELLAMPRTGRGVVKRFGQNGLNKTFTLPAKSGTWELAAWSATGEETAKVILLNSALKIPEARVYTQDGDLVTVGTLPSGYNSRLNLASGRKNFPSIIRGNQINSGLPVWYLLGANSRGQYILRTYNFSGRVVDEIKPKISNLNQSVLPVTKRNATDPQATLYLVGNRSVINLNAKNDILRSWNWSNSLGSASAYLVR